MSHADPDKLVLLLRGFVRAGGSRFSDTEIQSFDQYYRLVLKWNARLHLTTITDPQSFFERHLLESARAEELITDDIDQVWDLGTGLGVPGIPIAVLRPAVSVYLVESNRSKAIFLEEAISALRLVNAGVVRSRLERLDELPAASCLTARAVEKLESLIPEILRIGTRSSRLLIFGNRELADRLAVLVPPGSNPRSITAHQLPGTDNRFLIEVGEVAAQLREI